MTDHLAVQLSMRGRLLALMVCGTGVVELSATATGYHRATGSFIDDKFEAGMEVTPAGFAAVGVGSIIEVTDTDLKILGGRTAEGMSGGRSLTVGLPKMRAWDNRTVTPTPGVPYLDEQYLRGPNRLGGISKFGRKTGEPMYLARINVPLNTGSGAGSKYADAIVDLYPPSDVVGLPGGVTLEIRGDVAPYGGQLLKKGDDFAGVLCTVPLRVYSINSI